MFLKNWNSLLSKKFHLNLTLPGAFIDSYAKQPWNLDDSSQQEAFSRETQKLFSFANSNDVFMFRTVQDVLKENQELKSEVKCLNDKISNDIEDIKEKLTKNTDSIHRLNQANQNINKNITTNKDLINNLGQVDDEMKMSMNVLTEVKYCCNELFDCSTKK